MSIKQITPRMEQALRDNKELRFFADVWQSVLNKQIDSQADWQASTVQTQVDFTSAPGSAQLEVDLAGYVIENTSDNTDLDLYQSFDGVQYHGRFAFQSFTLSTPRPLTEINLKFDATGAGGAADVVVAVVSNVVPWVSSTGDVGVNYTLRGSVPIAIADAFTGVKTAAVSPAINLEAGQHWLMVMPVYARTLKIRYQNTDVLSGGSLGYNGAISNSAGFVPADDFENAWVDLTGDLYCRLEFGAYKQSGRIVSAVLDLGETPPAPGVFQSAMALPDGTSAIVNLSGSAAYAMTSPTVYGNIKDGDAIGALRFWQVELFLYTNADADQTPRADMLEVLFPKARLWLREKDEALREVDAEILEQFHPLIREASFTPSELKIIERVASGGSASLSLEDTQPDTLRLLVSDSPLKNYRVSLYCGADVPGFCIDDLQRFFIGIVEDVTYRPKYRGATYGLTLSLKNPILELKRKAPAAAAAGALVVGDTNIDHDKLHAVDSMLDIMRGKAGIPARYIDLAGFEDARASIGDDGVDGSAYLIRRSDAAGLPDTRIKTPEMITKHLAPLATIVDGYIVEDEASRITLVIHDTAAASEAVWADEAMVRAGTASAEALPIESVDAIKTGYADLLYNLCYVGNEWDGSGSDWTAFTNVYASVDADSADDFGMGAALFLSLMEKNMKEVGKWLGPEAGYNGWTLAQAIAERMTARFGYPPVRLAGCVLPMSQFLRTLGSVVTVQSEELVKFGRRGIGTSETVKFMVTAKKYDKGRNRMIFDLMELT